MQEFMNVLGMGVNEREIERRAFTRRGIPLPRDLMTAVEQNVATHQAAARQYLQQHIDSGKDIKDFCYIGSGINGEMAAPPRVELGTSRLTVDCSTTELRRK